MPLREAFNLAEAKFGTLGATGSYNTPKDVHGSYRGRDDRRVAGVLLHRACRRGRGGPGDGVRDGREDLDRGTTAGGR